MLFRFRKFPVYQDALKLKIMRNFSKTSKKILTALVILSFIAGQLLVFLTPQKAQAATPNSMMVYSKSTNTPYYRIWDGTSWGGEQSATAVSVGADIQYVVLKFARTRDEAILGTLDSTGDIRVQTWNGSNWSATTLLANVGTTNDAYRGFDIEYETSGDRAIVVYNNANAADPAYRIWDGTSWNGPYTIDIPTTNAPVWIELAANPLSASNDIVMMITGTSQVYGMCWTGASWNNMGVSSNWDSTPSPSSATKKCIDVAYEQSDGHAMFIWADSLATDQQYRIWNGTTLSGPTLLDIPASGGVGEWVRLVSNPTSTSNQLMYGVQDAGADINTRLWNGSSWDTATQHPEHEPTCENIASMNFDLVFETYPGNEGKAWIAFGDGANITHNQWNGSAWVGEVSFGDDTSYITLHANPTSGAVFMGQYENSSASADDIFESRLTNGGTSWTSQLQIWNGGTTADPVYFRIAIASDRWSNIPPNAPSNLGPAQYVDDGWTTDNTPTLTFDLSDPNTGQQVKYRIQIDDATNFVSPVVDYTSALGAQGSRSFTVGQAAGGGSYTVGSEGQTLADSSIGYWWRVKCIDALNAESSYSDAGVAETVDFKVDVTAPVQGDVYNSDSGYPSSQVWFADWGANLYGNWPGWTDATSGIATYDNAVGNVAGKTNILGWQNTASTNTNRAYSGNRNEVFIDLSADLTMATIYATCWNSTNKIWLIGGSTGSGPKLYKYNGATFTDLTSYLAGWSTNDIKAISWNGSYWLIGGTNGRLNQVAANPTGGGDFTDKTSDLGFGAGNAVNAIGWNSTDSIWLIGGGSTGSAVKLSKYNGTTFTDLSSYLNNFGTNAINTLQFNGTYWLIGGDNAKLNRANSNPAGAGDFTDKSGSLAGWTGQAIYSLCWSSEKTYWLVGGASNGTTARLNKVNSDATTFTDASSWLNSFGNNAIRSIYWNGNYWLIGGEAGKLNWANHACASSYDFADKSTDLGFGANALYTIYYAPYQYSAPNVDNWDYWLIGGAGNKLSRYGVNTYYYTVKANDNATNTSAAKNSDGQRLRMLTFNNYAPYSIIPDSAGTGPQNSYVDYNFTLYNTQSSSDTITISASSSRGWTVQITSTNPVTVGGGGNTTVTIRVNIPPGAPDNQIDVTTVTATSGNASAVKALATCTTTVVNANISLSIIRVYDRNGDYSDTTMDFGNVSPDLSPFIIGESLTDPYGGIRLEVQATGQNFNLTVKSLNANFTSGANNIPIGQLDHATHALTHIEGDWIQFSTSDYTLVSGQSPGTYTYDYDYRLRIYWDNNVASGYTATIQYTATLVP